MFFVEKTPIRCVIGANGLLELNCFIIHGEHSLITIITNIDDYYPFNISN